MTAARMLATAMPADTMAAKTFVSCRRCERPRFGNNTLSRCRCIGLCRSISGWSVYLEVIHYDHLQGVGMMGDEVSFKIYIGDTLVISAEQVPIQEVGKTFLDMFADSFAFLRVRECVGAGDNAQGVIEDSNGFVFMIIVDYFHSCVAVFRFKLLRGQR
jgi:hypothetical protein